MKDKYHNLINQYKLGDPRTLGWSSATTQQIRFQAFEYLDLYQSASILDIGSGYGDFYHYLFNRGYKGEYLGIEQKDNFFQYACDRYGSDKFLFGDFTKLNFKRSYEYVLASGLFWLKRSDWTEHFTYTIQQMWSHSSIAIGFNVLSPLNKNKKKSLYYPDWSFLIEVVTQLTPKFAVKHDYHPKSSDTTLFLFK